MGRIYQCWWRICREINVFSRFEYHMFYVLYPFVTYLMALPRITPFLDFANRLSISNGNVYFHLQVK
jgi:hypothetical protein